MVCVALYRPRRRDRPADAAERTAGRIRFVALGTPRARRRPRGAVPARHIPDRSAGFCGVRPLGVAGEALDSGLLLNILRPAEPAESARYRRRFDVSEPFCIDRRLTG